MQSWAQNLFLDPDMDFEGWWMILFYGTSEKDINLSSGWKGSVADWCPGFKVSGLCLVLQCALCKGWTPVVSVLPPLPRDLCKEGLSLSPLAFASHRLCCFRTAEVHTGWGLLWKWPCAHSEIRCILATLKVIFQDVSFFSNSLLINVFLFQRDIVTILFEIVRGGEKINQGLLKIMLHPGKAFFLVTESFIRHSDCSYQRTHLRQELEPLFP